MQEVLARSVMFELGWATLCVAQCFASGIALLHTSFISLFQLEGFICFLLSAVALWPISALTIAAFRPTEEFTVSRVTAATFLFFFQSHSLSPPT